MRSVGRCDMPVGITDDRERMRELTFFDAVRADRVSIVRGMLSREPGLAALRFRPADGTARLDWPGERDDALNWEAVAPDDLSGDTALLFAAAAGRVEMVETLLQFGADPRDRRGDGRGPVDLADDSAAADATAVASLIRSALASASTGLPGASGYAPGNGRR
jgi:hypothetical protein